MKFFIDELFKFLYINYKFLYCIIFNYCFWLKKCIVICIKSRILNILREFMFRRIVIYMIIFGYSIFGRIKFKERRDSIGINFYYFFDNFFLKFLFLYEWNCWYLKSFMFFFFDVESSCAIGIVRFRYKEDIFMFFDFMRF